MTEAIKVGFDQFGLPVLIYPDKYLEFFPMQADPFPFVFITKEDGSCEVIIRG